MLIAPGCIGIYGSRLQRWASSFSEKEKGIRNVESQIHLNNINSIQARAQALEPTTREKKKHENDNLIMELDDSRLQYEDTKTTKEDDKKLVQHLFSLFLKFD